MANRIFEYSAQTVDIQYTPINFELPSFLGVPPAGPVRLDGFGEDRFLAIEPPGEEFTQRIGADGKVTLSRNITADIFDITLTLNPCCPANGVMDFTYTNSQQFGLSITIQNQNQAGCSEFFLFDCCRIRSGPTYAFGTTVEDREYTMIGVRQPLSGLRRAVGASGSEINNIVTNN